MEKDRQDLIDALWLQWRDINRECERAGTLMESIWDVFSSREELSEFGPYFAAARAGANVAYKELCDIRSMINVRLKEEEGNAKGR